MFQVYDAIVDECNKQGIYIHLDNHMSKGAWCCGGGDGNTWFGDTYFNTAKWKRGWEYMAKYVRFLLFFLPIHPHPPISTT